MNNILKVEEISKTFRDYGSEWKRILTWFGLKFSFKEEHHILKDISFDIAAGEAIGIIGQNGAGKSTLLKIITGTLRPSQGSVEVVGRISSILELGMGFHPDLTGRQNVYHSSGLMGFTKEQVDAVIADIEAFAEIGEYFDQPTRTYSSGMQVRVAFSVVTAYRPEILIIDEALSVGDAYFQHKSFSRIRDFQKQGTTLLLVSHDRGAIQAICDRAILIEQGSVIKDGDPEEVFDYYNALISQKENSKIYQSKDESGMVQTVSGTGEVRVKNITLYSDKDEKVEYISVGDSVTLRVVVEAFSDVEQLVAGYMIKDRLGQVVYGTNTYHYDHIIKDVKKGDILEYSFSFEANLGVGSYSIAIALHSHDTHLSTNYEWRDHALLFNVVNTECEEFVGINWMPPRLEIRNV